MLHLDGFEQYGNETNLAKPLTRAEYVPVGALAVVAGRGRASRALSGVSASLSRIVPWTTNKLAVGFAATFTARGAMASIKIGATDLTLWMNPDTGLPNLNATVGGALPTKDRWYYYEIEINRTDGMASLYINNRFDCQIALGPISGTEADVRLGFRPVAEYRPDVQPVPNDSGAKTFDDLYIRDDVRLGPIMITTRFPGTDVVTEWFVAGGNPSHATTLAQLPPDPLDNYVASDQIGQQDVFVSAQLMQNTNDVIATGIVVLARKSPTLNAKLNVFMGGSISDRGEARTVESEWRTQFVCFDQRGGDTIENIQNSQFGINVAAP